MLQFPPLSQKWFWSCHQFKTMIYTKKSYSEGIWSESEFWLLKITDWRALLVPFSSILAVGFQNQKSNSLSTTNLFKNMNLFQIRGYVWGQLMWHYEVLLSSFCFFNSVRSVFKTLSVILQQKICELLTTVELSIRHMAGPVPSLN